MNYDALILISFGGPEDPDDVIPFLENVLRGRNVPRERMLAVAEHYQLFGGVSPINQQNRDLISAIRREFDGHGINLPLYFGNRNWHPMLADTLRQMRDDGIKNALAFVTSAYSSYSSCRQYLENIEAARHIVGPNAPKVEKLRAFYKHPEWIAANVDHVRRAFAEIPEHRQAKAHLVFTAHSIPMAMAAACKYEEQLLETSRLIAECSLPASSENGSGNLSHRYRLVFQSRSGSPAQPWLGPDINDYLSQLKTSGEVTDVVIAPVGFISDHMEVVYDLDIEAKQVCQELGLNLVRAKTAGTHPAFIKMIRELVFERIDPSAERRAIGFDPALAESCAPGCCLFSR